VSAGILCQAGQEPATGYVLRRPPEQTAVLDVLQAAAAQGKDGAAHAFSPAVALGVEAAQSKARVALGAVTVAQALAAKGNG
jgi:DNA-binding IscR family transcriptional regulator